MKIGHLVQKMKSKDARTYTDSFVTSYTYFNFLREVNRLQIFSKARFSAHA
jgi:hypothetical protein